MDASLSLESVADGKMRAENRSKLISPICVRINFNKRLTVFTAKLDANRRTNVNGELQREFKFVTESNLSSDAYYGCEIIFAEGNACLQTRAGIPSPRSRCPLRLGYDKII